jgi:hypothetical protein
MPWAAIPGMIGALASTIGQIVSGVKGAHAMDKQEKNLDEANKERKGLLESVGSSTGSPFNLGNVGESLSVPSAGSIGGLETGSMQTGTPGGPIGAGLGGKSMSMLGPMSAYLRPRNPNATF